MTDKTPSGLPQPQTVADLRRYLADVMGTGSSNERIVAQTALHMLDKVAPKAHPAERMGDYKRIVSHTIGYEWGPGELQTVNADDLLRLIDALSAPAVEPVAVKEATPITVEAVATVIRTEDGLALDWLLEGGIAAMVEGETLLICGERLTDDTGTGEVYLAEAKEPSEEVKQRIIAEFLERTGQYVTNDATRNAAIAEALDWAASMATHQDPRTGDWYYDDPQELAKAIRKGPDECCGRTATCRDTGCAFAARGRTPAPTAPTGAQAEPSVRDDLLFNGCNDAVADMIAGAVEQAAPKAEPSILRELIDELRWRIRFKSDIKVADLIRRAEKLMDGQGEGE